MREKIGDPAAFEMLAEECIELAHAALKVARILRGENPTPVTFDQGMKSLTEEVSDVILCLRDLDIEADMEIMNEKINRFYRRWRAQND